MPVRVLSKPAVAMHSTHAEVSAFHFFRVEEMAAQVASLAFAQRHSFEEEHDVADALSVLYFKKPKEFK